MLDLLLRLSLPSFLNNRNRFVSFISSALIADASSSSFFMYIVSFASFVVDELIWRFEPFWF